jgi:hypothetical protein
MLCYLQLSTAFAHHLMLTLWLFLRLTYADMDVLFENKVSARNFRKVKVDPYRSEHLVVAPDDDEQVISVEKVDVKHG